MRACLVLVCVMGVGLAACGGDDDDMADVDGPMDAAGDADDAGDSSEPTVRNLLSSEGLYSDFENRVIAEGLIEYTPAYPLWSDGTVKRRWLKLPAGEQIDTSNMDDWRFPIGTQVWKEFKAANGTMIETRLVERQSATKYVMGTFVWSEDQTDAVWKLGGQIDVNGTEHDVPRSTECLACHAGEPGRVLGFSALQLGADLMDYNDLMTVPATRTYALPGSSTEQAALGYIHSNCGHCHTATGAASMQFPTGKEMWLDVLLSEVDGPVSATRIYTTTVGVTHHMFNTGMGMRVAPGDPAASGISTRMKARGMDGAPNAAQMPPLATEVVDPSGTAAVDAWITGLSQ